MRSLSPMIWALGSNQRVRNHVEAAPRTSAPIIEASGRNIGGTPLPPAHCKKWPDCEDQETK
jgi:hypothetical protein